jgi:hypothetical protein
MIVPVVSRPHYRAHLEPILALVPHATDRTGPDDVALVASYIDLTRARRLRFRRFVLAQHGAGQSYGGDSRSARHPAYPGGEDNADVGLFLVPNAHAADRWQARYPAARVAVVGSPRLDALPAREGSGDPVVAVSFHWDPRHSPEARSAFPHYTRALPELARRYRVLGHAHPLRRDLAPRYRASGIEFEPDFDAICRQADVYVADNTSTLFEFAATGRPVVVLNAPGYRRSIDHGLRFWSAAGVGVNVDEGGDLVAGVERALLCHPDDVTEREWALDIVYAHRSGAAQRAAEVIREWAG